MSVNASLIDWEQLSGAEVPVTETPLVDPCPPQDSVPVSSPIVNYVVGGAVSLLGAAFLKNYQKVVTAYKVAPFFPPKSLSNSFFPFHFSFRTGAWKTPCSRCCRRCAGSWNPSWSRWPTTPRAGLVVSIKYKVGLEDSNLVLDAVIGMVSYLVTIALGSMATLPDLLVKAFFLLVVGVGS